MRVFSQKSDNARSHAELVRTVPARAADRLCISFRRHIGHAYLTSGRQCRPHPTIAEHNQRLRPNPRLRASTPRLTNHRQDILIPSSPTNPHSPPQPSMLALAIPLALAALVAARLHHSRVPEDPYAFPKHRVSFLNGLPLLNQTAQRWLMDGLRGGEAEFLDQPWQDSPWPANPLKGIESSDVPLPDVCTPCLLPYVLRKLMPSFCAASLGPGCKLLPATDETRSQVLVSLSHPSTAQGNPPGRGSPDRSRHPCTQLGPSPASIRDLSLRKSWLQINALSPPTPRLQHRQGWFTYSYCHNSHVRQFHELHHQQIPSTGDTHLSCRAVAFANRERGR